MGNDKTKWIFDEDDDLDSNSDGEFTENLNATDAGFAEGTAVDDNDSTRFVNTTEKTQIYHAGMAGGLENDAAFSDNIDPVVGWLVVVKGPGLGQSISIGAGMNSVGRDTNERISLPFGDTLISTSDHARVIYDDDSRSFYIAHGSGKNITKINGKMVTNTLPMENYALIKLSKLTHVRFVSFCNTEFDWSDVSTGTTD